MKSNRTELSVDEPEKVNVGADAFGAYAGLFCFRVYGIS